MADRKLTNFERLVEAGVIDLEAFTPDLIHQELSKITDEETDALISLRKKFGPATHCHMRPNSVV
jgi:hypothetical protein